MALLWMQHNEYDENNFLTWTAGTGFGAPGDGKDFFPAPWIIAPESIEPDDQRIWGFFVEYKSTEYVEWNQVTIRETGNHYSGGAGTWTEGSTPPTSYNLSADGTIVPPCMIGQGIYYTQSGTNKLAVPFVKDNARLYVALAPAGDPDSLDYDEWGDPFHPDDFPAWTWIDCGVDVGLDDDGYCGFQCCAFIGDCLYVFYRGRNESGFTVSYVKFCSGSTTPSSSVDVVTGMTSSQGASVAVFNDGSEDHIGIAYNDDTDHMFTVLTPPAAEPQTVTVQGLVTKEHFGIPEAEGVTVTQYLTY